MKGIVNILKHDLHKLRIRNFTPHKKALVEWRMKQADGIASWFSRKGAEMAFDVGDKLYIRDSYVFQTNPNRIKHEITKKREEIYKIFVEKDPLKLHSLILKSTLLNRFAEAIRFPYSSFKYHILLVCSIYWNLLHAKEWNQLYLCEHKEVQSQFQIIYRDESREWALLPNGGMSRVFPEFAKTWVRRTKPSLGGDIVLDGLLSQITSWSAALATIEDWLELNG